MTCGDFADIIPANIVLVDWGTSKLRLCAMDATSHICAEHRSEKVIGQLDRDGFGPEFDRCFGAMGVPADTPVLICGMAGTRAAGDGRMKAIDEIQRLVAILREITPNEVDPLVGTLFDSGFIAIEIQPNSATPFE